jgi:hypothetical protein
MKNTEDATEHTEVVEIDEEQEISAEVRHAILVGRLPLMSSDLAGEAECRSCCPHQTREA